MLGLPVKKVGYPSNCRNPIKRGETLLISSSLNLTIQLENALKVSVKKLELIMEEGLHIFTKVERTDLQDSNKGFINYHCTFVMVKLSSLVPRWRVPNSSF